MIYRFSVRQKVIIAVLAIAWLCAMLFGAALNSVGQNCQGYNDQGQCAVFGSSGGFSSYESYLAWWAYWDCQSDNRTVNNDEDDTNDVECVQPDSD